MSASSHGVRGGVSRRAVVKGAAWSVPVIVAASAAPALAASAGCDPGPGDVTVQGFDSCGDTITVLDILYTAHCPCAAGAHIATAQLTNVIDPVFDGTDQTWSRYSQDTQGFRSRFVLHGPQHDSSRDVTVTVQLEIRCADGGGAPTSTIVPVTQTFTVLACP